QDHDNLEPMLDGAKKNLSAIRQSENYFEGKQLTADSNYHSLHSLTVCQREQLDAYIPDIRFRRRDERFAERNRFQDGLHGRQRPAARPDLFALSDFSFDPLTQTYRCPNGKSLRLHARNQINRYRTYDIYHARPEDCTACPLRSRCLSKPTASRRYLSVPTDNQPPNLIDAMKAKIDTEAGKKIYARRLAIVEPVFANICVHKHMNRFTLRTKRKVDVQWRLYAIVHNIGKIYAFGGRN
ncbi:MAG: transposase, partial [Anaerolineales bacterium]